VIGVVLIAHRPLASALAAAASHVYSCAPERAEDRVRVLDIEPGGDVATATAAARAMVREIDDGSGVIVLTDVFGATPGNVASQLAEPGRIAVVAGVNLPMLLRVLCYREGTLADTVEKALAGGAQGVMQVAATPVHNQAAGEGAATQDDDLARLHHQQ
jgi:PTS system ascorbate-specific IIA component